MRLGRSFEITLARSDICTVSSQLVCLLFPPKRTHKSPQSSPSRVLSLMGSALSVLQGLCSTVLICIPMDPDTIEPFRAHNPGGMNQYGGRKGMSSVLLLTLR